MRFILVISLLWSLAAFSQESLFNHFSSKDGMISDEVYDVLQDKKGNVWFATGKGISKLQGFDFLSYKKSDGFESEPFIGLYQTENSEIWAYTSLGRLYRFTGSEFKPIALNGQIEKIWGGRIVNSFAADKNGNLYLSSVFPGEPIQINRTTKTVSKIGIQEKMRFYILEVDDGSLLNGSLSSSGGNEVLIRTISSSYKVNLGGAQGFTKSGFCKRSGGSFLFSAGSEVIDFSESGISSRLFTEKNIECVFEDSEGKVWVGLNQGGLLCFPEGDIASLNKFEYLGKRTVTDIYEDDERNLWFSTSDDGVYQMSLTPQIVYTPPVINSKTGDDSIREVVGISQGSTAHEVFLGDQATFDTIPPKVFFSDIEINNRDTIVLERYDLMSDQNFIKVDFVGSTLGNPGLFQYKYRMSGVDKEWVYTSSNSVQYTMLPPGEYELEVSAMSKAGLWSENSAKVVFVIHPMFYQTFWFRATLISFLVCLIILGMFLYIRRIRNKEEEKLTLGKKIADLELSALRAQMNPHFIFNTLSSIQHYVSTNSTEEALRYLSKFAKLMRIILDNSKKKEIPVKDEVKAISLYLELEKLRFKDKFDFEVKVSDQLDESYDYVPSMLIQPYIENAILHGIMNKEGKGKIAVELRRQNSHMVCEVVDDGVGREKAMKMKNGRTADHKSQGMMITKDRLEIINKVNESQLSVEIEDAFETSENKGTRVRIYIPVHTND